MNKYLNLTFAVATITAGFSCSDAYAANDQRPDKPNVLFILTDDLGWQDVKCYDIDEPSPYETPRLDEFSKESVMFWQAYSPAPTSAPSRGAMLTGRHPARLQRTHVVGGSPVIPRMGAATASVTPWYSGRLPVDEITLPELLKPEGYVSGHIGKWHIAIDHHAYPQPKDHGFDFTIMDTGVTRAMKPDRLSDFASDAKNDPFQLDENGFPKDQNNINALNFIKDNKDKPFFLYYATWLVHSPIQTRAKGLLDKYVEKMGVPYPTDAKGWTVPGQKNPYYGAMVEMMDYYVGQVLDYLRETEDPRWPGHKLVENTYIIFTSDNGGMEGSPGEIYTDNYPLDKGKINVQEGGIRVPFFISGPGIPKGVQSDVMISGLDIFPTILSWAKAETPKDLVLDGADLSQMLVKDPKDATLVKMQGGDQRSSLIHHFPHSRMHSTIRMDGYKLIHNFDPGAKNKLELYQLYDENNNRVDIEEAKNLADVMPSKAKFMDEKLMADLKAMGASFPYYNPQANFFKNRVGDFCEVLDNGKQKSKVWITYKENKNKVVRGIILYTLNGNQKNEEWYQMEAQIVSDGRVEAQLPKGTTHYIFGLIDNEEFLTNYPDMGRLVDYVKGNYAINALSAE